MRLVLIFLLMLVAAAFAAGDPPLLEAPNPTPPPIEAPAAGVTPNPDDDFPAFLAVVAVFSIIGALVLTGIGIVVAAVVVVGLMLLVATGILSSAVLVGVLRRRVAAGVRALHYQVLGVLGSVGGVGVLALWAHFVSPEWTMRDALLIGALAGGFAGVAMAFGLDRLAVVLHRRFCATVGVR